MEPLIYISRGGKVALSASQLSSDEPHSMPSELQTTLELTAFIKTVNFSKRSFYSWIPASVEFRTAVPIIPISVLLSMSLS